MKTTPLHELHSEAGGNLVSFAGWSMPLQYGPILEEVGRVRSGAGLFDLSHMGRFRVSGQDAARLLDLVVTNHCARIPVDSIRYAVLCREDGGALDDLLVYRNREDFFVVVNASNTEADLEWMRKHASGMDAEVSDLTDELAMIAVQGPRSAEIVQRVTDECKVAEIGYYKSAFGTVCRLANIRISRTGYTGELGYELYLPASAADRVWNALLEAGRPEELAPVGLGARDILRLEAGMALYGHELDLDKNPVEADLGFAISFAEEKGEWIGRSALQRIAENPRRRLIGLTTPGPRIPRQDQGLLQGDEEVGFICSGAKSPTLETHIATAYVQKGLDRSGENLEIDFRGKRQSCTLQELPFYSRTRK